MQASALRRNLQVLSVAAWVLVALNAVHIAVFGLLTFDESVRDGWARQIAMAHGVMAVLMALTGWLSRRLHALVDVPAGFRALPLAGARVGHRVFAAAVHHGGADGVAWVALSWALGGTADDAALLTANRMNAASATALAILVSVLFWRHYARTELLQRALAETNRQLEAQRTELEALATRDPLTGLLNRREFVRQADLELARARRLGAPLSLIMLDLDHFKTINDRHGHAVGDEVLRQTARHLAEKLREGLAHARVPALGMPVTASLGVATVSGTESVTHGCHAARGRPRALRGQAEWPQSHSGCRGRGDWGRLTSGRPQKSPLEGGLSC